MPLKNFGRTGHYTLAILSLVAVAVILFFGLWPKTWPIVNDVHWSADKEALQFQNPGIAYVDDVHTFGSKHQSGEFTIHISVAAKSVHKKGFRAILMIHGGDDRHQLAIWQWRSSVIVMNGDDYDNTKKWPRISAKDALTPGETSFLTITANKSGTRLFVNGTLAKEIRNWQLAVPGDGTKLKLILGNSVYGKHGWAGDIYGLAFYNKHLSPEKVQHHYDKWIGDKQFSPDLSDAPQLLYTFKEFENRMIPDLSGHNKPLQIPSRPVLLKKTFLTTPWHHFKPNRSFFADAILNLLGFIPLGAVTYYLLHQSHSLSRRNKTLLIMAFCFSISLSIETLQVWLPDRTSSLLDLTLNTLGAWLGILLVNATLKMRSVSDERHP